MGVKSPQRSGARADRKNRIQKNQAKNLLPNRLMVPLPKHSILIRKVYTLLINNYVIQNNISNNMNFTIDMKRKSLGYSLILLFFGIFGLIIYGAYVPSRKAQKQQIVCFKFKEGTKNEAVEQHMREFAALKHEIPQIISYTSGKALPGAGGSSAEYDVVHYLTFQSEADIETYNKNEKQRAFVKNNAGSWDKVFIISSDIRQ
ncbi:Dabb family protein [Larkinella bovis]|uniref:Dabb family protein n=1 Tax=Larkinella bovis TaxID=683041 RepID=A0ABW0I7Q9_9BACT